jgi:hypothetical protein
MQDYTYTYLSSCCLSALALSHPMKRDSLTHHDRLKHVLDRYSFSNTAIWDIELIRLGISHLIIRCHSEDWYGRWPRKENKRLTTSSELIYTTVPHSGPDLLRDGIGYRTTGIERMETAEEEASVDIDLLRG